MAVFVSCFFVFWIGRSVQSNVVKRTNRERIHIKLGELKTGATGASTRGPFPSPADNTTAGSYWERFEQERRVTLAVQT